MPSFRFTPSHNQPDIAASLELLHQLRLSYALGLSDGLLDYLNSQARFVVAVARQYQGRGVAWEHLLAAGQQGLIRAWETYNWHPDRLERMGSWWVRQTIATACAAYLPS